MKKRTLVLAILMIAAGILFVLPGFEKRTDVYLLDFSISEDGSVMTLKTMPAGSMGFIRSMETETAGNEIHCSFYRTFGGLNSGIGAKSCFQMKIDDSIEKIYFDRGAESDHIVLERDAAASEWNQR